MKFSEINHLVENADKRKLLLVELTQAEKTHKKEIIMPQLEKLSGWANVKQNHKDSLVKAILDKFGTEDEGFMVEMFTIKKMVELLALKPRVKANLEFVEMYRELIAIESIKDFEAFAKRQTNWNIPERQPREGEDHLIGSHKKRKSQLINAVTDEVIEKLKEANTPGLINTVAGDITNWSESAEMIEVIDYLASLPNFPTTQKAIDQARADGRTVQIRENPLPVKFTYEQAKEGSDKWHSEQNVVEPQSIEQAKVIDKSRVLHKEGDYFIYRLVNKADTKYESSVIDHCVGWDSQNYWRDLEKGLTEIFSLRDKNNVPQSTAEIRNMDVKQINGNGPRTKNVRPSDDKMKVIQNWLRVYLKDKNKYLNELPMDNLSAKINAAGVRAESKIITYLEDEVIEKLKKWLNELDEKEQVRVVFRNTTNVLPLIKYIENANEYIQAESVRKNPRSFKDLNNPTDKVIMAAVSADPLNIEHVKPEMQTHDIQVMALENNGVKRVFKFLHEPSTDIISLAVHEHPPNVEFIKTEEQTTSIKNAVAQFKPTGDNLPFKFIHEPNEETIQIAVDTSYKNLQFVPDEKQTEKMKVSAVDQSPTALKNMHDPSDEIIEAATAKLGSLLKYVFKKGKTPSEKAQVNGVVNDDFMQTGFKSIIDNGITPSEKVQTAAVFLVRDDVDGHGDLVGLKSLKSYMDKKGVEMTPKVKKLYDSFVEDENNRKICKNSETYYEEKKAYLDKFGLEMPS